MQRVATREGELRQLRAELLPQGVRGVAEAAEGQNHWGFSMQSGTEEYPFQSTQSFALVPSPHPNPTQGYLA